MYQIKDLDDTIAAISTATGQGGIGIIRLSGKDALSVVDKIFQAKNKRKVSSLQSHTVTYGWIVEQDMIVDEVLLSVMRGPRSYTTEDVIEINCHGGSVSLQKILTLVMANGARLAEPGEFTKRAFLNGRIDLTQAEAVLDIIQSKTDSFLKVSTNQLKGELSMELEGIREELLAAYVELEAIINFPEDEIDAQSKKQILDNLHNAFNRVEKLLASSKQGQILREGIKIVLCGKPNVGKSSLLNALLKTPRAIVSSVAGTTRDTIEETAQIKGIPLQLVDTAGILEPRDLIEEEAVKRSRMYIDGADLVLCVLDVSRSLEDQDKQILEKVKNQNVLYVLNKCDLPKELNTKEISGLMVEISVVNKKGIDDLEQAIVNKVLNSSTDSAHNILVNNIRHIDALKKTQQLLERAQQILIDGTSLEFVSEEMKQAVNYLDGITGRNIDEDLLSTIFSQFCIGK